MNKFKCKKCGIKLNNDNWSISCQKNIGPDYICKQCKSFQVKKWQLTHPGYKLKNKYFSSKFCKRCNTRLPTSEFQKNMHQYCRSCRAVGNIFLEKNIERNEFITYENIRKLKEKQNYCCYVCGKKEDSKSFHLDHDHDTGKIRGWACPDCNIGFIRGLDFLIKNKPEILDDLLKSNFIKNILENPPGNLLYEES